MRKLKILLACTLLLASSVSHAVPMTFSLTGNLNDSFSVQLFEFDVSAALRPRDVIFETFAAAGGTNRFGEVFNAPMGGFGASGDDFISDGFEPAVFLYDTVGNLTNFVSGTTSSSGDTDLLLFQSFFPGTYTLALTNLALPNSNNLADGFEDCPSTPCPAFQTGLFTNNGPLWAIDFVGVEDVRPIVNGASTDIILSQRIATAADVPEPASYLLMGLGLLGLTYVRRRNTL